MPVTPTPDPRSSSSAVPSAPDRVGVVVACYTFERLAMLEAALDSVRSGSRRPDRIVVVVDFNDELHAELTKRGFSDVDVIANTSTRGLGGARNSGVAFLGNDVSVVAFLDDDVRADHRWLERLVAPFADPDVWGVGGWADSSWDGGRPSWFPATFDWVIGCSWDGLPRTAGDVRNPIGCSMAFRREAFDVNEGFRVDLGRTGSDPVGCEETEFAIRLRQRRPSARIVLAPDAVVTQTVPVSRASLTYFARRCLAEGRSKASMVDSTGSADGLSQERRHVLVLLQSVLRDLATFQVRRAAATVFGLTLTGWSYAWTRAGLRLRTRAGRRDEAKDASKAAGASDGTMVFDASAEVHASRVHCPRCRSAVCATPGHASDAPTVSLIIPTRNEARNLHWVLSRLPDSVTEVVLVDGGSTDDTVEVARRLRPDVRVISQPAPGKGAAIAAGLLAASGDVVVMIDADGSMDPVEVPLLVAMLVAGADVVKGSRRLSGAGSADLSVIRSLGNWALSKLANVLYATRWSELNYGLAAFHRDVLPVLGVPALVAATPPSPAAPFRVLYRLAGLGSRRKVSYGHGFEIETLLFTRASRAGLRVCEVASFEYERRFGASNLSTWRDGLRVLGCMLAERLARRPTPAVGTTK